MKGTLLSISAMLGAGNVDGNYDNIMQPILEAFNSYVIPALMIMATIVLVVFGVINGIRLAKSSQEEEKQKAKKNIIGLLLGALVCVGSIWLLPLLIDLISSLFPYTGIS